MSASSSYYSGTPESDHPPRYTPVDRQRHERAPLLPVIQDGSDNDFKEPQNSTNVKYIVVLAVVLLPWLLLVVLSYRPCAHESLREEWKKEEDVHEQRRIAHEQERNSWLAEKAEMDQWHAELERKRAEMTWTGYQDLKCSRYSTRRFTAILDNVAAGLDPRKECEAKEAYVDDQWRVPTWCEDKHVFGKMTAFWEVDSRICKPYFSVYEDHGCYRPGVRLYKAKMDDIRDKDNWHTICMSMTGIHHGTDLGKPIFCSPCRGGSCGYWAEFTLDDDSCY